MKARRLLGWLALGSISCAPAGGPSVPADLALINARVVPMTSDTVLEAQAVLIRDGRITAITPMAQLGSTGGAAVLDLRGRYVMPGIIDTHVHLRAESELASYLRHGVTAVVNMRGSPQHIELRNRIAAGELQGPRIFTSGPLVDGEPPIWSGPLTRVARTPRDIDSIISEHVRAGYDLVKVYNNLDPQLLALLVRSADTAGLSVVGHLPRTPMRAEGLRRALAAGIDMIAHSEEVFFTEFRGGVDSRPPDGNFVRPDQAAVRAAAERIAAAGVAVTPNLSFVEMTDRMLKNINDVFAHPEFVRLDPDVRQMWREQNPTTRRDLASFAARERVKSHFVRRLTLALRDAGALLLLGTDASAPGMYPGVAAHVELEELVRAGLSPYEAIATGTLNAGRFLENHVRGAPLLGRVVPGATADLLIVDEDPLHDVRRLRDPWRVIAAGLVIEPDRPPRP